jgi:ABC-type sugar transport system substrate-binding protein
MGLRATVLTALLVCPAGVASGCGDEPPTPTADRSSFAAIIKGLDNPFFGTMRDGLVATARAYGTQVRVKAAVDQNDAAGQAARLDSQAASGAGCFIVNPIDGVNLIQSLSRLAKGTPIVNIDSPVARRQASSIGVRITTYIGTDNVAAGTAGADEMAQLVPRGARVAVLTGPSGDVTSGARITGFRHGAGGRFRVVASPAADFDRGQAKLATEALLADDRRVAGIFAANDLMALGASTAVKAAGKQGKIAVIGVDGIEEALTAIRRGAMSATVAQYPYTIGQLGVQACVAALRGKRIPPRIDAPIQVVERGNVERAQASFPEPLDAVANPLDALLKG